MRKIEIATRVVAVVQVLLCVCAALFACSACQRMNLGRLGAAFYGALFLAILRRWDAVANLILCAAVAVHAALAIRMMTEGYACGFCIGATIGCLSLVILRALQFHGLLRAVATYLIPLSLVASTVLGWVSPAPRPKDLLAQTPESRLGQKSSPNLVTVTVFENPGCPYCERLRKETIPVVEAILGDRIAVNFQDAQNIPAVRLTPTILLSRGDSNSVFEGLPNVQLLVREVQRVLARD